MRFAKNVSMIKNAVTKNEQVDPALIIRRLKNEISNLKAEIALLKGTDECKGGVETTTRRGNSRAGGH